MFNNKVRPLNEVIENLKKLSYLPTPQSMSDIKCKKKSLSLIIMDEDYILNKTNNNHVCISIIYNTGFVSAQCSKDKGIHPLIVANEIINTGPAEIAWCKSILKAIFYEDKNV